jgi:hypothetical protein
MVSCLTHEIRSKSMCMLTNSSVRKHAHPRTNWHCSHGACRPHTCSIRSTAVASCRGIIIIRGSAEKVRFLGHPTAVRLATDVGHADRKLQRLRGQHSRERIVSLAGPIRRSLEANNGRPRPPGWFVAQSQHSAIGRALRRRVFWCLIRNGWKTE